MLVEELGALPPLRIMLLLLSICCIAWKDAENRKVVGVGKGEVVEMM